MNIPQAKRIRFGRREKKRHRKNSNEKEERNTKISTNKREGSKSCEMAESASTT